jgi:hypothetical protein
LLAFKVTTQKKIFKMFFNKRNKNSKIPCFLLHAKSRFFFFFKGMKAERGLCGKRNRTIRRGGREGRKGAWGSEYDQST